MKKYTDIIILVVALGFLRGEGKRLNRISYHPVYNVILAIDNSGSMDDSVWAERHKKKLSDPKGIRFLASELAVNVLSELQSSDSISDFQMSVYSFAQNVVNLYPLTPLKSREIVKSVIDSIYREKDIITRHVVESLSDSSEKRRAIKKSYTNFNLLIERVLKDVPRYKNDTLIVYNGLILITDGAISGISDSEVKKYFKRKNLSRLELKRLKYRMIKDLSFKLRNRGIRLYVILIGKATVRDTSRWRYYASYITGGKMFYLSTVDSLLNYIFKSYMDFLPISHFDVPKLGSHHRLTRARSVIVDSFVLDSTKYPYLDELKFMLFVSSTALLDSLHIMTPSGLVYSSTSKTEDDVRITSYRYTKAITVNNPEYGKWKLKIWGKGEEKDVYIHVHLLVRYPYLALLEPDFTYAYPEKTKILFKGIYLSKNGLFLVREGDGILAHLTPEIYIYKLSPKKFIYGGILKYKNGYFYSDSVSFPERGVYLVRTLSYYLPDTSEPRKKLKMGNPTSNLIFISKIPKIVKTKKDSVILLRSREKISLEFRIIDRELADSLDVNVYLQKKDNKNVKRKVNFDLDSTRLIVILRNTSHIPGTGEKGDYKLLINYSGLLTDPNVRSMFNTTIEPYLIHYRLRPLDYIARAIYALLFIGLVFKVIGDYRFKRSLTTPIGTFHVVESPTEEERGEKIPLDMYGKKILVGINKGDLLLKIDDPIECDCFEIFTLKRGNRTTTYLKGLSKAIPIYVDGEEVSRGKKKELFDKSVIEIGSYFRLEYIEDNIPLW